MSLSAEQTIGIAEKMYHCRRTLRRLMSSNYQSQVLPYMRAINERVEKFSIPLMSASLQLAQGMQVAGCDMGVMWILAAAVELSEPDESTPTLECEGK